jgi:hypothetical protein
MKQALIIPRPLGGHLEVLAVFPEETITVLREPDPCDNDGAA